MTRVGPRLAIALLAACTPDPVLARFCAADCVANDPAPRWACEECQSDADCLAGLTCAAAADTGTGARRTCRWMPQSIDSSALTDGFRTRTMDLHVTPPPDLRFEWSAPDSAAFVACAIFRCRPEFAAAYVQDVGNGPPFPWAIANADRCMLRLYATDAAAHSISIARMPRRDIPSGCGTSEPRYDDVIDFVAAGCWAYDSNVIVAASELLPLTRDTAAELPELPVSAVCTTDHRGCRDDLDATHAYFGACLDGICEPRCMTAADCEDAAAALSSHGRGPGAENACGWECLAMPASPVGVCRPRCGAGPLDDLR